MPNKSASHEMESIVAGANQKGFTLLELLIALTVFLIVTSSIYGLLKIAQRGRSLTNQQTHLTKNVRVALNLLGRDTFNAGFGYPGANTSVNLPDNRVSTLLGIPNDFDTTRDRVPPIIAGNNVTLNTYNKTPGTLTDQVTFLFKDSTFNPVGAPGKEVSTPLEVSAITAAGEVTLASGSNAVCSVNDIYVITGGTGSALGVATALTDTNKIQFANADSLGFNLTGTNNPLTSVPVRAALQRISMVTYFVTADGTLIRREYANTPPTNGNPPQNWVDEPLVYGVENFQIRYVMDDGTLTDNPSAGPDGIPGNEDDLQANLAKVRQVRFTISVRNPDPIETINRDLNVSMTSTFSTRNLGYDAN